MLAWASSSIRVPSRTRNEVRPGARVWGAMPVYGGETSRTVESIEGGRRTTLTSTSRIELTVVAAGDREPERLVDRLQPAVELAPLRGPERLDVFFTVGEAVGGPGRVGNPVSGPDLHRKGERVAAGDLERRPLRRSGPGASAAASGRRPRARRAAARRVATAWPARENAISNPIATAAEASPAARMIGPVLDRLAKVDRSRLLDRLPDRRRTQRRRAVPLVGRGQSKELDRAGQSRSFRPGHRCSIFSAMSRSANRTTRGRSTSRYPTQSDDRRHGGQEREADKDVELEEPVGQAGHDHQRHDGRDHPAQAVEGQEPPHLTTQGGDS